MLNVTHSATSDKKVNSVTYSANICDKYLLPIADKFNQPTRRFGRINFARMVKFSKHNT